MKQKRRCLSGANIHNPVMVGCLIGYHVLQNLIQIIAKIYSKAGMTCWKIIQKAGPNVLTAFIQIGNIVYAPEEADMLVF